MKNLLITGGSRGLGAAFSAGVPDAGDHVWLVSRSQPSLTSADGITRAWVEADLSDVELAVAAVRQAVGDTVLDVLIYNAGIWEGTAFSSRYDFEQISLAETQRIIAVNMTSAIATVQALLPNLRRSANPKIILIGSINGMDNNSGAEVAYNASKFGLRGVAQALRENLRMQGVGVTCINPGTISTEVAYEAGLEAALQASPGQIPMQDLVALVCCVVSLSRGSSIKEIDMPAMGDSGV